MKEKILFVFATFIVVAFLFLPFLTIEGFSLQLKKEEVKTEINQTERVEIKKIDNFKTEEKNQPEIKNEEEVVVKTETGIASWYGSDFHGQTTANGETYNMYKFTAAHKELSFGTEVKVICLETRKEVVVTINDRGPFVEDRIIDLSMKAAIQLELKDRGLTRVRLEVLG